MYTDYIQHCTNMKLLSNYYNADTGQEVLELCKRNIDRNISQMEGSGVVNIRELDWTHPFSDTGECTNMHSH